MLKDGAYNLSKLLFGFIFEKLKYRLIFARHFNINYKTK